MPAIKVSSLDLEKNVSVDDTLYFIDEGGSKRTTVGAITGAHDFDTQAELEAYPTTDFEGGEFRHVKEVTANSSDGFSVIFRDGNVSTEVDASPDEWVIPADRLSNGGTGAWKKTGAVATPVVTPPNAPDVPYTPETAGNWTSAPDDVAEALDGLAESIAAIPEPASPQTAPEVPYTPNDNSDWDVAPDDVAEALDKIADSLANLPTTSSQNAPEVPYTPSVTGDWDVAPDDVAEALDALAAGGGSVVTGVIEGANAEIYELSLSADVNNITGDSSRFTVPFDTGNSVDWGSTSGGLITLQAGTYIINGKTRFTGGSGQTFSQAFLMVDGVTEDPFIYENVGGDPATNDVFSSSITLNKESVISIEVLIDGGTKTYDLRANGYTSLRITKLPVQPEERIASNKILLDEIILDSAGEFDFNNIPQGYDRLIIEATVRSTHTTSGDMNIYFNGDLTPTNYHRQQLAYHNSSLQSGEAANSFIAYATTNSSPTDSYMNVIITIDNSDATTQKIARGSYSGEYSTDEVYVGENTVVSSITDKINTIKLNHWDSPNSGLVGRVRFYGERSITKEDLTFVDKNLTTGSKILLEEIQLINGGRFDFSNIPTGYTNLIIEGSVRGTASSTQDGTRLYFNGDSVDSNYATSVIRLNDGSSFNGLHNSPFPFSVPAASSDVGAYADVAIRIDNYSNGDSYTNAMCTYGGLIEDEGRIGYHAITQHSQQAINSISVISDNDPTDQLLGTLRLYGEKSITEDDLIHTIKADGQAAEVYELGLISAPTNITGDGSTYMIPFDNEKFARSWASNNNGVVTLQAGTYIIEAGVNISGGSGADRTEGRIYVDGVLNTSDGYVLSGSSVVFGARASHYLTITQETTVDFRVWVSGGSKTYDVQDNQPRNHFKITRLPISTPMIVEGASADVYEVNLTNDMVNVTGAGAMVVVAFDAEVAARNWASNNNGVVTLQAGVYVIDCGAYITDGNYTSVVGRILVDDTTTTVRRGSVSNTALDGDVNAMEILTLTSPASVKFTVQVNGGASDGDIRNFEQTTYMRITRLPVQAPFSDVIENTPDTKLVGLGDLGKWVECTSATGTSITVPPQADVAWPPNVEISGASDSAPCTFVAGSGVTIRVPAGYNAETITDSAWTLKRIGNDNWRLIGMLTETV